MVEQKINSVNYGDIKYDNTEIILILSYYCFVALSSIRDLGALATPGFLFLLVGCAVKSPRTGFLALISMFYLPMAGVKLPAVFIIATATVGLINILKQKGKNWYLINRKTILLYSGFIALRFVSIVFVDNADYFQRYFFVSFSVLIHIIVISFLIKDREDIPYILRMWGVIGALSAILGYLHFSMQNSVYLRQIFVETGDYDKSTIEGTFDYVRWIWAGAEPNFQGLILLVPFAINFFFLTKKVNLLNVVLTVITFLGILGTFSRTSFLVSIIITGLYAIMPQNRNHRLNPNRLVLVSVLFVSLIFIVTTYFPDFSDRIETIQEAARGNQGSGRFPLYKEALQNFFSNPLFGVGTGQTPVISKYHLESHNLFLQTLGENGLFSFIILISLFWWYIREAYKLRFDCLVFFIAGIAVILNANTVSYFDMRVFFSLYVLLNYCYWWRCGTTS